MCERVEGLMLESSINESFKQLQECHQQWKEIGPVPSDKSDEIWERFKNASDAVNKRRQEYYDKMKEEQSNNLLAKIALCEKLEELLKNEVSTVKQWNEMTNEVNELFNLWKTIGTVPKSENEAPFHTKRVFLPGQLPVLSSVVPPTRSRQFRPSCF